jgi:hypothetical protein
MGGEEGAAACLRVRGLRFLRSARKIGTRCVVPRTSAWCRGDERSRDAAQRGAPRGFRAAFLGNPSHQRRASEPGGWSWAEPPSRSRVPGSCSPSLARRPFTGPTRPPDPVRGHEPSRDLAGVLASRPTRSPGDPRPALARAGRPPRSFHPRARCANACRNAGGSSRSNAARATHSISTSAGEGRSPAERPSRIARLFYHLHQRTGARTPSYARRRVQ